MSGDLTVVQIYTDQSILQIKNDATILSISSDTTILSSAPATISVPYSSTLSDSIPVELSINGSAGISTFASRSDHSHPVNNLVLNGGNF